jgi:hypothetical protein
MLFTMPIAVPSPTNAKVPAIAALLVTAATCPPSVTLVVPASPTKSIFPVTSSTVRLVVLVKLIAPLTVLRVKSPAIPVERALDILIAGVTVILPVPAKVCYLKYFRR